MIKGSAGKSTYLLCKPVASLNPRIHVKVEEPLHAA